MQARIVRTREELRSLEGPWNEMLRESSFQAPFHSWEWHESWWKSFGGNDELFVVAVEDSQGRLQVVAPLAKTRADVRGFHATEVRFFPYSLTPHNTILFRNSQSPADALCAVFTCLAEHRNEWDMLNMRNVPAGAPYLPCLHEVAQKFAFQSLSQTGMQSAVIGIQSDFESYMNDAIRKSRKRGILQKVRQLTQRPEYRVQAFSRPDEIERGLELAFAVSKASWKGPLGTDMTGLTERRSFYVDVTPRLASRGEVKIWISFLEDVPVALEYQILARDIVYFIVNDFNDAYQKLSPGTVLLCHVLENLYRDKSADEFYFSGDLYDYKTNWATGLREHVNLEIFNDRAYSRCLCWAKKAMPLLRTVKANVWAGVRKVFQGQAT